MQPFPHQYRAAAFATTSGPVAVMSPGQVTLNSVAPVEFGGPGDEWSPEAFVTAAVADCFVLTFRAVARASKLQWTSLECQAVGTLDRVEGGTAFTAFVIRAALTVPPDVSEETARRLLEQTERHCPIARSLKAPVQVEAAVTVQGALTLM